MLFGPADVKYARSTQPDPVGISIVKKGAVQKIGLKQKIKRLFWNLR